MMKTINYIVALVSITSFILIVTAYFVKQVQQQRLKTKIELVESKAKKCRCGHSPICQPNRIYCPYCGASVSNDDEEELLKEWNRIQSINVGDRVLYLGTYWSVIYITQTSFLLYSCETKQYAISSINDMAKIKRKAVVL